jgi:tripartite-type tricarboxylate transporter receptor subunit TctC
MNARALLAIALLGACAAYAQQPGRDAAAAYPTKPIRFIVPFAAGGPNDLLARLVGKKFNEAWGQQAIVDNRGGGGTIIGTEIAARATPDGYTLLMVSSSHAVNVTLVPKLPFDMLRDFAMIAQVTSSPNVLVVNANVQARSVRDLINLAKAKPGTIAYGSGGTGAATHLAGELLCIMGGVKMTHVPYKGAGPVTVDLLAGQIQWMFGTILPTLPHVKAGRLRAIGVSGDKRNNALPDVPTVAETLPGFEATSWYGIAAPAGTPRPIIDKLNAEIARMLTSPDLREQLIAQGSEPVGGTPAAFTAHFRGQIAKWGKVIREAGIRAEP